MYAPCCLNLLFLILLHCKIPPSSLTEDVMLPLSWNWTHFTKAERYGTSQQTSCPALQEFSSSSLQGKESENFHSWQSEVAVIPYIYELSHTVKIGITFSAPNRLGKPCMRVDKVWKQPCRKEHNCMCPTQYSIPSIFRALEQWNCS